MKHLLFLPFVALLGTAALAQIPTSVLDQNARIAGVTGSGGIPPEAVNAHVLIDEHGNPLFVGRSSARTLALVAGSTVTYAPAAYQTISTLTPAQAETINATTLSAAKGSLYTIEITTSGTTSFTVTFGTGFTGIGTLETGTVSGVVYEVVFVYDGTNFCEVTRKRQGSSVFALTAASPTVVPWGEGLTSFTDTPTGSVSFNAPVVARANAEFYLIFTTSGTSSFTITFATNFKSTGTLATGTTSGKIFVMRFVSDGTNWDEVSRTAAQ